MEISGMDSGASVGTMDTGTSTNVSAEAQNTQSETQSFSIPEGWKDRVIVDGEEREVTYEELKKDYELRAASHKRMEEAARIAKLIKNPKELLKSQEYSNALWEAVAEELDEAEKLAEMSPEQRRLKELEEYRANVEAERERAEIEAHETAFKKSLLEVLDTMPELPRESGTAYDIMAVVAEARELGKTITPQQASNYVLQKYEKIAASLAKTLPPERLYKVFGPEAVQKIRQYDASRVRR